MTPTDPPAVAGSPATQASARPVVVKALIVLILALAVAAAFACFPSLKAYFGKAGPVAQWFRALHGYGGLVFVLGSVVLILLGIPRLALCTIAGVLYGFWLGLFASLVASMISYYVGFAWIRGRQHKGLSKSELPAQLAFLTGDPGLMGVMISRVVPAPGMLITLALALSNVSSRTYLLGSAIGLIPEAVPAVLLGSMGINVKKWGVMLAIVGIGVLWFLIHHTTRRFARQKLGN